MNRSIGLVCVVACAASANAGFLASGDLSAATEQTGSDFSAVFEYAHTGGSSGELTITLQNITPPSVGGFLTGIIFNIDSMDAGASASLTSTTDADFLNTPNANGQPFGMNFDGGAALGANWEGGGNPSFGVPIGGSATFVFAISASDAAVLGDDSFARAANGDPSFIARFRGGIDSDKVPATPAPGAVALLGLGGLVVSRRHR